MGKIVWIASYPKSGSTWLRAFLHNYILGNDAPQDINNLMQLTTGESGTDRFRRYDKRPPQQWRAADVQRMRPFVHRDIAAESDRLVFVKTHNAALLAVGVPLITPQVTQGSIYILRDPRDVAVSYSRHLGLSLDRTIGFMADAEAATGGTATKVYEAHSSWSRHAESWLAATPAPFLLRYEDMLEDPASCFGGLVEFLGETPDRDRLARAIRHSGFDVLRAQEQQGGFVERPAESSGAFFASGRAGAWREVLTPAQRTRIERDHLPVMARFGYLF